MLKRRTHNVRSRVQNGIRKALAPLRSQAAILMYHRISTATTDPWGLCVSPKNFEEQLQVLRRNFTILSLGSLVETLKYHRLPRRAVVLTFDDGYADNFLHAKPLLEAHASPATIFVATGFTDSKREFWWDELERLLYVTPELPARLRITLNNCPYEGDAIQGSPGRQRAYFDLYERLLRLEREERDDALDELWDQVRAKETERPEYRALTTTEICQLAAGDLIEIGSHTVNHPLLSAQCDRVQQWEMSESKRRLESIVGKAVTTFCYPFGAIGTTSPQLAKEAGFEVACSTVPRTVTRNVRLLELPRFYVGDWGGEELNRRLRRFFRG